MIQAPSFYQKLEKDEKYILTCCFFVFAVNGLYAMILGSLLPAISTQYGLSDTVSGALLSSHQVGNLIAGFIAGILPVYLGRKKAIIFLSSFVIAGFFLMIITGNPILLLLGFLFTGLSRGSISNFNNTVVNEVSGSSSSALNFLHSIFAIGALLSPFLVIVCTYFAGANGWRIAVIVIISLVIFSIFLFSRMKIDDSKKKVSQKVSYIFLKNRFFWVSAGILFFYLATEATINGWIVKYFVDAGIMTTAYAQMLASLLWVVILAGRLTCTFIGDRISKKTLLLTTSIGTIAFYGLLLATTHLGVITFAIMGLGFSMAGIYPTTISTVGPTIKLYPMAMGVLLLIGGIGSILMPLITGALSDAFGIFYGMLAIIMAFVFMMICIILTIKSKPN
jgi:fucose permease